VQTASSALPGLNGQSNPTFLAPTAAAPRRQTHAEDVDGNNEASRVTGGGKVKMTVQNAIQMLVDSLKEDGEGDGGTMTPDGSWIRDEDLEPLTHRLRQRTVTHLAQELRVFYQGMAPEKVPGAGEVAACYSDDTELLNASLLLTYGACLPLEPHALERARARARSMRSEKLLEEQREEHEREHERLEQEWRERERVAEEERQRREEEQARKVAALEQQLEGEMRAAGEKQQRLEEQARAQEEQLLLQQRQLGQQLAKGQDELQRFHLELQQHFTLLEAIEGEAASADNSSSAASAEKRNAANVSSPLQRRTSATDTWHENGGLDSEKWKRLLPLSGEASDPFLLCVCERLS